MCAGDLDVGRGSSPRGNRRTGGHHSHIGGRGNSSEREAHREHANHTGDNSTPRITSAQRPQVPQRAHWLVLRRPLSAACWTLSAW
jgi:hypothetical protein